ncbi:MAG TPA: FxsA family protein [Thiotrichales bacterium]|nr:FxsA family protein [Thiotrichales bacterium]
MSPFAILFLLFLTIPLVEVYLLIKVGGWIGALPTIGLVVFTAVLGAALLRIQGLETLQRFQMTLASGQIPAMEMLEGVVLAVSGALLLTPGFLTDTLGFLGLVPPVRRWLVRRVLERFLPPGGPGAGEGRGPVTLEGEYRRLDDN